MNSDNKPDKSLRSQAHYVREAHMTDEKLDRMSGDITDIKISLAKIESTLERNTESLVTHVKRTDLLEQKVDVLKEQVTPVLKDIQPVLRYWKILSVIVIIAVTASNPSLIPILLKLVGVPVP